MALVYCSRGDRSLSAGDVELALADFSKAAKIDQNCVQAYVGRAECYEAKGERYLVPALEQAELALNLDEYNERALDVLERIEAGADMVAVVDSPSQPPPTPAKPTSGAPPGFAEKEDEAPAPPAKPERERKSTHHRHHASGKGSARQKPAGLPAEHNGPKKHHHHHHRHHHSEAIGGAETESAYRQAATTIVVPPEEERDKIFAAMDYNGNGFLSLAEVDKAIGSTFPELDNKPALMRAFKAADVDGNGFVRRNEFRLLLQYLEFFNSLWKTFEEMDTDGDRRVDKQEFLDLALQLGVDGSAHKMSREFAKMDNNGGGFVLFEEFCSWSARRVFRADVREEQAAGSQPELPHGLDLVIQEKEQEQLQQMKQQRSAAVARAQPAAASSGEKSPAPACLAASPGHWERGSAARKARKAQANAKTANVKADPSAFAGAAAAAPAAAAEAWAAPAPKAKAPIQMAKPVHAPVSAPLPLAEAVASLPNEYMPAASKPKPKKQWQPPRNDKDGTDMHLMAWGRDNCGQLGLGRHTAQREPVPLGPLPLLYPPPSTSETQSEAKLVECGSQHTILATTAGSLWAWGSNECGQLGTDVGRQDASLKVNRRRRNGASSSAASEASCCVPQRVRGMGHLLRVGIRSLACGETHTALVDGDGKVFTWGNNERGQLGLLKEQVIRHTYHENHSHEGAGGTPKDHESGFAGASRASAGGRHTPQKPRKAHLTPSRSPHRAFENQDNGSTSVTQSDDIIVKSVMPALVAGLGSIRMESIACGSTHTVAISEQGAVYSWGYNADGQLGLGHYMTTCLAPQLVEGHLLGRRAVMAACGAAATLVLTEPETHSTLGSADADATAKRLGPTAILFAFGSNKNGNLGLALSEGDLGYLVKSPVPQSVPLAQAMYGAEIASTMPPTVLDIACGGRHMAVVARGRGGTLSLWTWGLNDHGQLGLGSMREHIGPEQVPFAEGSLGPSPPMVRCGTSTTFVSDEYSGLWAWGRNNAGQLGFRPKLTGSKDVKHPQQIASVDTAMYPMRISAGDEHSVAFSGGGARQHFTTTSRRGTSGSLKQLELAAEYAIQSDDPSHISDCIDLLKSEQKRDPVLLAKLLSEQQKIQQLVEGEAAEEKMGKLEELEASAAQRLEQIITEHEALSHPGIHHHVNVRLGAQQEPTSPPANRHGRSEGSAAASPPVSPAFAGHQPSASASGKRAPAVARSPARQTAASASSSPDSKRIAELENEVGSLKAEVAALREQLSSSNKGFSKQIEQMSAKLAEMQHAETSMRKLEVTASEPAQEPVPAGILASEPVASPAAAPKAKGEFRRRARSRKHRGGASAAAAAKADARLARMGAKSHGGGSYSFA